MLDYGTTAGHSNRTIFPDRDALDGMQRYTMGFFLRPRAHPWTAERTILAKNAGGNDGFLVRTEVDAGANTLSVVHGNGTNLVESGHSVTDLLSSVVYSILIAWDGANESFYVDNVLDASPAFTQAIAQNAASLFLGNDSGANGAQCALGHVMIWPGVVLTAEERDHFHRGNRVPGKPAIWHRGRATPGFDVIEQVVPTTAGTVVLLDSAFDAYFQFNPFWRQLASELLLPKSRNPPVYTLTVPLHFLKLAMTGLFNVSHDGLLRSASHLAALGEGHQLIDKWRRGLARLVGFTTHRNDRRVTLEFEDAETSLATFFSTFRSIGGVLSFGLAYLNQGGLFFSGRTTTAYLEQENNLITTDSNGVYLGIANKNIAKINHLGLLCEGAIANKVVNPVFASGLTSWTTQVSGAGSVAVVTDRLAWPSGITGNSIEVVGEASQENTFRQTIAMLSADAFARLSFIHSDRGVAQNPNWQIQRSSDNFWWDDALGTWVVGSVANGTPGAFDPVNNLEIALRFWSKPIPIANDENWTVRIGKIGAATAHNFYHVNLTVGKLRYSPLIDTGTTQPDVIYDELSLDLSEEIRQNVYAGQGTISIDMVAEQDSGDMVDGDQFTLFLAQFGTSDKDFYAILYQKLTGENARFSFERWIDIAGTSTLDVRATKDVSIVRGTTYKICARYIGATGELGLLPNTMRISIDGVNGVDAVAAGLFSTSERFTKLRFGNAPAATGFLPSFNYLAVFLAQQRVVTDEEVASL